MDSDTLYFLLTGTLILLNLFVFTKPSQENRTSKQHSSGSPLPDCPGSISQRARRNNDWFQQKHAGHLARVTADKPSIDLMTAENFVMRPELLEVYKNGIVKDLSSKSLSYADGMGGDPMLLQVAAEFFNRYFRAHVPVEAKHIVTGAGCSAILDNLLWDICERGDGVLIETPFWGGFETSFVLRSGAVPVHVPLSETERVGSIATFIAAYERVLVTSTFPIKALLLCNPHNPLGTVYREAKVQALVQFCEKHHLHFVSDEIYGLSTFPDAPCRFKSVLQLDLQALGVSPSRVHMIYSISKDFGSSGLRLGFLVTQANADLRLSLAISNHSKVSTLTSLAATAMLRDTQVVDQLLHDNLTRLVAAARQVTDFLTYHSLPFVPPAAGVFVWACLGRDCSTFVQEAQISDLLRRSGVTLGAGQSYCARQPGWFRITFALEPAVLYEALRRVEDALALPHRWPGSSERHD